MHWQSHVEKVSWSLVNHDIQKPSTADQNSLGSAGVWCCCHSHILCAVASHFVLQQWFLCHGVVLHAVAVLFSLQPWSLCRSILQHAMVLCYMLWCHSLCHGKRRKCHGIVWHHSFSLIKKRCAVALHIIPCHCFFVPQQETTCCCIL